MDNTKTAEWQNVLDEHRCTFTNEHRYSGNSQHLQSMKSWSEDLPQKKNLQLPILTLPIIFTFKWNFLFQMHKVPSRIWLKMPQRLKVDARRPETKVASSVYAPYLPWDGKDSYRTPSTIQEVKWTSRVNKSSSSGHLCYLQLTWKTYFSGTIYFFIS